MPRFDIISGNPAPDAMMAYAIVRNEIFYLPAFLNHHRALGIEQFIFLDDRSTDGTREYLCDQPDCMVIGSRRRFGDPTFRFDGWKPRKMRCGIRWKTDIPHQFALGRWALYLDADEFLILPAGINSVRELCDEMDRRGSIAAGASMVEFYPATLDDIAKPTSAGTLADLLSVAPYFDAKPVAPTTTRRLFHRHGLVRERGQISPGKVPLVRWSIDRYYPGSHSLNVPPDPDALLCLLHFKFTPDLARKIDDALKTKAYVGKSKKYREYVRLFELMRRDNQSFKGPHSVRFQSVSQLIDCGLLSSLAVDPNDAGSDIAGGKKDLDEIAGRGA